MFRVAHIFIHTFVKEILAQVSVESTDVFRVAYVLIHTFAKLILHRTVSNKLLCLVSLMYLFIHS